MFFKKYLKGFTILILAICFTFGVACRGGDKDGIVSSPDNIEIEAQVQNFKLYSFNVEQSTTFENGGTASINTVSGEIVLDKISAGDKVGFDLLLTNKSNIPAKYQAEVIYGGELSKNLVVEIVLPVLGKVQITDLKLVTDWVELSDIQVVIPISVYMPVEKNPKDSCSASIYIKIQVVQA